MRMATFVRNLNALSKQYSPSFIFLSILIAGLMACGKDSGNTGSTITAEPVSSWTTEGGTYSVVTTLSKSDTFFGEPGLTIYFLDNQGACDDVSSMGRHVVEIFFPQAGSQGYLRPRSVGFYSNGYSSQESSTSGYPGAITLADLAVNKEIKGWVDFTGIMSTHNSIRGTFVAQYCPFVNVTGTWKATLNGTLFSGESPIGQTTWITLTLTTQSGTTVSGTWSYSDTKGRSGSYPLTMTVSGDNLTYTTTDIDPACVGRMITATFIVISSAPGSQMTEIGTAPAAGTCQALNYSITYTKQ